MNENGGNPQLDIERTRPYTTGLDATRPSRVQRIPSVLSYGEFDPTGGKAIVYTAGDSIFVEVSHITISRIGSTATFASIYFRFPEANADGSEDMFINVAEVNPFLRYEAKAPGTGMSIPPGTSILLDTTASVKVHYLISGFGYSRLLGGT